MPGLTKQALFARFASDRSGATAIEYALIATLISVAIVVGATALGVQLDTTFQAISERVADVVGGGGGEPDPDPAP
jgi:pilus assembly protein Flp/PilA